MYLMQKIWMQGCQFTIQYSIMIIIKEYLEIQGNIGKNNQAIPHQIQNCLSLDRHLQVIEIQIIVMWK